MVKDPTELIHCDNCGEDYAAAYRRCPFCNAKPGKKPPKAPVVYDEFDEELFAGEEGSSARYDEDEDLTFESYASPNGGGRRLVTNRRGGGYGGGVSIGRVVGYVLTALIVAAAIWAVITQLLPRLLPDSDPVEPTPTPAVTSAAPTPAPTPSAQAPDEGDEEDYTEPLPGVSGLPAASSAPSSQSPAVSPSPAASQAPATGTLQLSAEDFTLSNRYPTYQMEISGVGRAQATYVMADETIATVNSTGYITARKNGVTKLTVTASDGRTATAIVRVSGFTATAAEPSAATSQAPAESTAPSGGAALSSTDFTLSSTNGKSYRLTVSGGTASYWTSSNEAVATVGANGTVTAVSRGTAKITCGLTDGSFLTCIVRVS